MAKIRIITIEGKGEEFETTEFKSLKYKIFQMELGTAYVFEEDDTLYDFVGRVTEGSAYIKCGRNKLLCIPSQAQKNKIRRNNLEIGEKVTRKRLV